MNDDRMALLSAVGVHDIFKAHLAGPFSAVAGGVESVTFGMSTISCRYCSRKGSTKVTAKGYTSNSTTAVANGYHCSACNRSW